MLGHGRLGQRCNHAASHTRGRMLAQWATLVVNGHAMALAGE